MPDTGVTGSIQASEDLTEALIDVLNQMVGNLLGGPSKDKSGKPLRQVCYMQLPLGTPIEPTDYSDPYDPTGASSDDDDIKDDPKTAVPPVAAAPASNPAGGTAPAPDPVFLNKQALQMRNARNTATLFDTMLRVTNDGTYKEYSGGGIASAYENIIIQARAVPAPPLPPDVQKKVDDAMHLIHVYGDDGSMKGFTKGYKSYQALKQAYGDAETAYANAYASAMSSATLARTWTIAAKSYQTAVDNAWDDWRSSDADTIENALDTIKAQGGSIGAHFIAEAQSLFSAWSLPLAGAVAVATPYTQVLPSTWWDATDDTNGFVHLTGTSSHYQSSGQSNSSQFSSNWYKNHASSTSGGGGGMVFGITFGGSGSHSASDGHSGSSQSGAQSSSFSSQMSAVTIHLEYGLCSIYRPWLLREIFDIDGWYLPGQPAEVISDGTIAGQNHDDDHHLMPMISTQFLVVRNVRIEATGWGSAGDQMSQYCKAQQSDSQASASSMSGAVGFLSFGATASRSTSDSSGDASASGSTAGAWSFAGDHAHGILSIPGCQIVGYIGEIMPASPKMDGTKQNAPAPAPAPAVTPAPAPAH